MDKKKVHVLLHPLSREGATIKMKFWKGKRRELLKSLKKSFSWLNRKKSIHLSVRYSDGKLDKSYPLKCE